MSKDTLTKQINRLFAHEDWTEARKVLMAGLRHNPNDHWLLVRLATTYYEQHRYNDALEPAMAAIRIVPNCPLVLWELAGITQAKGRVKDALEFYRTLLHHGLRVIEQNRFDEEPCWEGPARAQSLMVDAVYRAGTCYQQLGENTNALGMFELYRELRDAGAKSIYDLADVERRIKQLKEPKQQERVRLALRRVEKLVGPATKNLLALVPTA